MERIFALIALLATMYIMTAIIPDSLVIPNAAATMSFGFLILTAYLLATILRKFELPKITGYIIAGMLLGPSMLGLLSQEVLLDLKLVDDLALTFIAFAAGGELRMSSLRARKKSIGLTLVFFIFSVLVGITLLILLLRNYFPITAGMPFAKALAVALILAVIAVARSPSSAIAIISETKARGPFTDMVLGVTVVADVLTIFMFAVVLSFLEAVMTEGGSVDFTFFIGIGAEVASSLIIGIVLGRLILLYVEKVGVELVIFVLGTAFLVTKASHGFATILDSEFDVRFHLEPMLICLTAGFFIQNRSKSGPAFLKVIERSSLPIYVVFFAISGASLNIASLKTTWHFALALVALRGILIWIGTYLGGRFSGDPKRFQKAAGFGFLTQAGVSLGLAKVVADRFGELGVELAALIVATITINQIIGPLGMKQALSYVGETKAARIKAITSRKSKPT